MNSTRLLHNMGQNLWLDNITRGLLNSGTLSRYIDELSVTGLTSTRQFSIRPFAQAGTDVGALAARLQDKGAKSFVKSWNELLSVIESKSAKLQLA